MKQKTSITKRWALNTLGIFTVIMAAVAILSVMIARNYYMNSARQFLSSQVESAVRAISQHTTSSGYRNEVMNIIESFPSKDKYELMAVSSQGKVTLTSSGFAPDEWLIMPDYEEAKASPDGLGFETYILATKEEVMGYTVMLSGLDSQYSALRIMTSVDALNEQVTRLGILLVAIVLAIIGLMLASGLYFVRTIVLPVSQITETAKSYAEGDFSERIEKERDDELGELIDAINNMAQELENNDRMKNEFISSVSHELRTPLTAIKGWSETLSEIDDDPETFRKGMRVITGETQRLSEMVEELLDFSRIQDGRFTLKKETTDILAELGDAVLIYTERAKDLGIEIIYNEPEQLHFVHGDPSRLRQVFINIIDNAVKYSNPGDRVMIDAYERKGEIIVIIADTGVGIDKKDLPKIKTKFYKANHTRRGSGIGLAVANEIVEMHDGSLTINSEPGKGTTVMIVLPAI